MKTFVIASARHSLYRVKTTNDTNWTTSKQKNDSHEYKNILERTSYTAVGHDHHQIHLIHNTLEGIRCLAIWHTAFQHSKTTRIVLRPFVLQHTIETVLAHAWLHYLSFTCIVISYSSFHIYGVVLYLVRDSIALGQRKTVMITSASSWLRIDCYLRFWLYSFNQICVYKNNSPHATSKVFGCLVSLPHHAFGTKKIKKIADTTSLHIH